jgi:hypothetical protein
MSGTDIENAVLAAAGAIVRDFGSHETAAYFSGFAEDASFLFYTVAARLDSRAAYEALWAQWEKEFGFRVHGCQSTNQLVTVRGEIAIFTHDVETRVEMEGAHHTLLERESIVFERRHERWLAVHEHLSPKP